MFPPAHCTNLSPITSSTNVHLANSLVLSLTWECGHATTVGNSPTWIQLTPFANHVQHTISITPLISHVLTVLTTSFLIQHPRPANLVSKGNFLNPHSKDVLLALKIKNTTILWEYAELAIKQLLNTTVLKSWSAFTVNGGKFSIRQPENVRFAQIMPSLIVMQVSAFLARMDTTLICIPWAVRLALPILTSTKPWKNA